MISQHDILPILQSELVGFSDEDLSIQPGLRPYCAISHFTNYTKQAVNHQQRNIARKCFQLARRLYNDGDITVKRLMDNYFIYSFSGYLPSPHSAEIRSLIPADLYRIYVKEMINNHC